MSVDVAHDRLEQLRHDAAAGVVHTVRVGWPDRLGVWRGKRIPVADFLSGPERRVGFCDGMIVVDVQSGIIQETPFSNFETGYPDMYVQPDLATLRRAGWCPGEAFVIGELQGHHGEPLAVAPRVVLGRVVDRLGATGVTATVTVTLAGRLMRTADEPARLLPGGRADDEDDPGTLRTAAEGLIASAIPVDAIDARPDGAFALRLGAVSARDAADHAFLAKSVLKEVAIAHGLVATFMTRTPGAAAPSRLRLDLALTGDRAPVPEPAVLARALADVRALLQPSANAVKAGPPATPTVRGRPGASAVTGVHASSEADPATGVAAALAAVAAAADGSVAAPSPEDASPDDLRAAADRLAGATWARDWLGEALLENALPLLRHEAALFAAAVTDWEVDRYWRHG